MFKLNLAAHTFFLTFQQRKVPPHWGVTLSPIFAAAVANPTQEDRISAMETQIQALIKENLQLKAQLQKVEEAQAVSNESIHTGVKEVQTINTHGG